MHIRCWGGILDKDEDMLEGKGCDQEGVCNPGCRLQSPVKNLQRFNVRATPSENLRQTQIFVDLQPPSDSHGQP